jgi:hypothetical protein
MTYFHTFWTWPQFQSRTEQQTDDIVLWDFEALTWLTSALEIRRHSPMRLVTDSRGLRFVQRVGLDWVYSGGISTALDDIPEELNQTVFWAAGKLFALRAVDTPCVGLDPDAILWEPFEPTAPVLALHQEPRECPYYAQQQARYSWCGLSPSDWDWELDPFNMGICYFGPPEAAASYSAASIRFMLDFSRAAQRADFWGKRQSEDFCDAMLLAEQRLLPMCMKRLGLKVNALARLQPKAFHLERNPLCCHLWGAKDRYRDCAEARLAFVNYLIEYLLTRYPEAEPTLAKWKLAGCRTLDSLNPPVSSTVPDEAALARKYSLLGEVNGVVWIEDANVGVRRRAKQGSLLLPGETLRAEAGATVELLAPKCDAGPGIAQDITQPC